MTRKQHVLESKAPPAAVTLAAALLMWCAAWLAPDWALALPAQHGSAAVLALAGALTCLAGAASFRRARTTVNPRRPDKASALVSSGIYRFSRNPMYLGFALILLGWAALLSNALALLTLPAFVLYLNRFQIRPEERALHARFGQDYNAYHAAVRCWL